MGPPQRGGTAQRGLPGSHRPAGPVPAGGGPPPAKGQGAVRLPPAARVHLAPYARRYKCASPASVIPVCPRFSAVNLAKGLRKERSVSLTEVNPRFSHRYLSG